MKRVLCLLVCLTLLFVGCQASSGEETETSEATETTIPTQITEPAPTTEPSEPELPRAELAIEEDRVGFLMAYNTQPIDDENVNNAPFEVVYCAWDTQNGSLSEPIPWLRQNISLFQRRILYWSGATLLADTQPASEMLVSGLNLKTVSNDLRFYGKTVFFYNQGSLGTLNDDGSWTMLPMPDVPEGPVPTGLWVEPFYAWSDGENTLLVYLNDDYNMERATIQYALYPVDEPDLAQWQSVTVSTENAAIMDARQAAYIDGKLYIGAYNALICVDISTGQWEKMDVFSAVDAQYPDAVAPYEPSDGLCSIVGCDEDILIVCIPRYTPDAVTHSFLVAIRNGQPVGIMELVEGDGEYSLSFYDNSGTLLNQQELPYESAALTFARND